MAIYLRNDLYRYSGKTSASTTYSGGNRALSTLVQAVLPYSSSEMASAAQAQLVIDYNNGNLSGEQIWAGNTNTNPYPAKTTNISMGALSAFSGSATVAGGGWNNNSGSTDFPTMTFKYVPYGWSYTGGDLYSECTTKIVDLVNYQSVNPNALSEQSYSAGGSPTGDPYGMKLKQTSSFQSQMDFGGLIAVSGALQQGIFIPDLGNGEVVPAGSGSFKVPQNDVTLDHNQSVVFAFWIRYRVFPTAETFIWGNDLSKAQGWTQSGYACAIDSTGRLKWYRGSGGQISNEVTWLSSQTLAEDEWCMVFTRLSSTVKTVGDTTNQCWIYKPGRRGYQWFSGLGGASSSNNTVGYSHDGRFTFNPHYPSGRHTDCQIGHFYMFWETDNSTQNGMVTTNQRLQMDWTTDSGSYQLYTL
jgi:hypothetical protein